MKTTAWMVVAATILAGCAATNDVPSSDQLVQAANELDLTATQDTGVIRGIVVNPGVVPIANAQISARLQGKVLSTNTSSTGAFGLEGLAPGTYFLTASKAGFATGQTSTEVVAGVSNPPVVKMTLEPDASTKPFVQGIVSKGYIECSATAVFYSVAACSVPNNNPGCGEVAPCNVTTDVFIFETQVNAVPTYMQSEMLWDSTQPLGAELALVWSFFPCESNSGLYCDPGKAEGVSPLLLQSNATILNTTFRSEGGRDAFFFRVFNADLSDTQPPSEVGEQVCIDTLVLGKPCARRGVGFTLEQPFEIYTHFFYGYQPPEWRFSSGAEVPKPPA